MMTNGNYNIYIYTNIDVNHVIISISIILWITYDNILLMITKGNCIWRLVTVEAPETTKGLVCLCLIFSVSISLLGYPIWTYTYNEHSSTKYNLWIMGIQCPFDNINTISQFQKSYYITFSVLTEQRRKHVSIVWSKSKNLRHRQL